MRRSTLTVLLAAVVSAVALPASGGIGATGKPSLAVGQVSPLVQLVVAAQRGTPPPRLPNGLFIPMPSGGLSEAVLETRGVRSLQPQAIPGGPSLSTLGCQHVFRRAGAPANVRANQDCGFRFQSEEWVSVNPTDHRNIVVSQNDSKLSGNRTGVDFSLDGARHFGDSVLPNGRVVIPSVPGGEFSFDAFSDPASTFDSRGNYYYTAIGFDAFQDPFAGVFAWKANSCLEGSALHTPGSGSCHPFVPPISASAIPVRTNFTDPRLSDDKQMMAADVSPTSRFRDNVYVTWTIFDFRCGSTHDQFCESKIFFSRSTDGARHWSTPKAISGSNPSICHFANQFDKRNRPGECNFDQGSFPVVGPDGTIYVVFNNTNTSKGAVVLDGVAQQLFVKSRDGGLHWTRPVKVGDDFQTQPFAVPNHPLPGGCPLFRPCLPPNGYRVDGDHFPSMGIDERTGKLAVFWSDFRNGGPCAHAKVAGVPDPVPVAPCKNENNDVFVAVSQDRGRTWGPTRRVREGGKAAQWQQWGDVGENGKLYVAYYDRSHGNCDKSGCNDITLSVSSDDGQSWKSRRITTSSMPNLTCRNNPNECGFLGDYMSTQVVGNEVHMVWGDTRGRGPLGGVPEEDVYYARVPT